MRVYIFFICFSPLLLGLPFPSDCYWGSRPPLLSRYFGSFHTHTHLYSPRYILNSTLFSSSSPSFSFNVHHHNRSSCLLPFFLSSSRSQSIHSLSSCPQLSTLHRNKLLHVTFYLLLSLHYTWKHTKQPSLPAWSSQKSPPIRSVDKV